MKIFIPLSLITLFCSCNLLAKKTDTSLAKDSVSRGNYPVAAAYATEAEYTNPTIFPIDSSYGKMIRVGNYHSDEVEEGDTALTYVGLFRSATDYYFKTAPVFINHAKDAIVDEDDEITGWEVKTTPTQDSSIFLIANMQQLDGQRFNALNLSKTQILPGDSLELFLEGKRYLLYATGNRVGDSYENYKLFLSAQRNGKAVVELLAEILSFDDQMVSIILAGDLDGDKELDLLIDTSYHYNLEAPTLYLSKPAAEGHLLKVVARHNSVGC
ncbi:hypothetical protein DVR12_20330 [Chitinophaga silvatica]|uniref:VCBS repeat-containing protein n=1 Tax=Chitinophaga silvatica TaxID=2282649 RepID=A0A3E1Y5P5_9BACT|nr:hypothetical protein [Chitinophaga silvatica]RFS20070.1 hypothetical protein DVR12_20330 [Chitinophaga silvatica]